MRRALDFIPTVIGRVIPGLALGVAMGVHTNRCLEVSRHPDIVFLSFFWGALAAILTVLWHQGLQPWFARRGMTPAWRAGKMGLCLFGCVMFGLTYGESLSPPHGDPGQRLGGLLYGTFGIFVGCWLGWSRGESFELLTPEIGFEVVR